MSIAPDPKFPERANLTYDRKMAAAAPGQRGPLRFEEGVATDTDVPDEFILGAQQGYTPAAGRPNRNAPVHTKTAEETVRERAHVGSAAWIESQDFLGEFSGAAFADHGSNVIEIVARSGSHQQRPNPTQVQD
ncbi:MAG: hypothetical protein EBR82_18785 [Caulobacteraceae bacterium]|nr:hypothetical protein [Caulobacteraceae bacterium]